MQKSAAHGEVLPELLDFEQRGHDRISAGVEAGHGRIGAGSCAQRWRLLPALQQRASATVGEAAAGRQIEQVGHRARYHRQHFVSLRAHIGNRCEQAARVSYNFV